MAILTRVRPAAKEPPEALCRDSNQGFITQMYTLMPNVGASQYDGYNVVILKNHWHSADDSCYRPPSRTSCRSSFAAALTRNWSETKSWTLFRAPKPLVVGRCSGSSFFLWSSIDISLVYQSNLQLFFQLLNWESSNCIFSTVATSCNVNEGKSGGHRSTGMQGESKSDMPYLQ